MGLSTPILTSYKKEVGYSNADGVSTPNLDFLKSQLEKSKKIIDDETSRRVSYTKTLNDWKNERIRLSSVYKNCNSKKCRDNAQSSEREADSKIAYYQGFVDSATSKIKAAEVERDFYQEKIDNYQSSVTNALSKGVTDGGAVEIAEAEAEKAKQELKNLKAQPYFKYVALGALALGTVIILIARKR